VPAGARDFTFSKTVQTGSGARAASSILRSRVFFSGGEAAQGAKLTTCVNLVSRLIISEGELLLDSNCNVMAHGDAREEK